MKRYRRPAAANTPGKASLRRLLPFLSQRDSVRRRPLKHSGPARLYLKKRRPSEKALPPGTDGFTVRKMAPGTNAPAENTRALPEDTARHGDVPAHESRPLLCRSMVLTVLTRLLHPPGWVLLSAPPIVFAALVCIFITESNNSVPAYAVYVMSAYCLCILIFPVCTMIKKAKAGIMQWITGTQFGEKYVHHLAFRGNISIYQGMAANFLYAAFRTAVGIRYGSVWSISIAAYYLVLGALRLSLILSCRSRDKLSRVRCYRRTAWLLFLLNVPMGGMILLMVLTNSCFSYPGYVIYLSAACTFYTVTISIVNLTRFGKLGNPLLSAAKVLNFISALMSVLGLQTAMIAQFSADDDSFRRLMNTITGGAVWTAVILTAVFSALRWSTRPRCK